MRSVLLTWVSQKQLLPLFLMQCRWRKQLSIAAMAGDDCRHPVGCCWRRTAGAAPIISSSRGFGDSLMRAAEQPVHVSRGKHGSGRLRLLHHRACTNKHGGWCLHPRGMDLSLRVPLIRGQLTFHSDTLDLASRCACLFGDPRREECAQCGAHMCTWAQKSRSVCQSLSRTYRRTSTDTTKKKEIWKQKEKKRWLIEQIFTHRDFSLWLNIKLLQVKYSVK